MPVKLTDDRTARYYTYVEERVGGPYSIEGLETLVYLRKLTPDSLIAREGSEAYVAVRDSEMARHLFPNALVENVPENWAPPGQEADVETGRKKRYRLTEAKFEKVNDNEQPRVEVHEILGDIRQKEIEAGFDRAPRTRFRISKRTVDFLLLMILGNGLLFGGAIYLENTASFIFAYSTGVMYTIGLAWVMYGVMDRY